MCAWKRYDVFWRGRMCRYPRSQAAADGRANHACAAFSGESKAARSAKRASASQAKVQCGAKCDGLPSVQQVGARAESDIPAVPGFCGDRPQFCTAMICCEGWRAVLCPPRRVGDNTLQKVPERMYFGPMTISSGNFPVRRYDNTHSATLPP